MAIQLLGLSGSLRSGSFNTSLLRAATGQMPERAELAVKTIHGIPLYDGDAESAGGIPPAVQELGRAIAAADGLILASPEYNNSVPGPLKNAVDWLSRLDTPVFENKPVAIIGASPGGFGTVLAQSAWLPVLKTLECRVWSGGRLLLSRAGSAFADDGSLKEAGTREKLAEFLAGFVEFVEK